MRSTHLNPRVVLTAFYSAVKWHFRHNLPLSSLPESKDHRDTLKVYYFTHTSLNLRTVGKLQAYFEISVSITLIATRQGKLHTSIFYEYRCEYAKQNTSKPNPAA